MSFQKVNPFPFPRGWNSRSNGQVRRNIDKFHEDFMFQLTKEEFAALKSQIATSSSGWGGRRKPNSRSVFKIWQMNK